MDLDEKRSEEFMEVTTEQLKEEEPKKKSCVDCGTTKTPLWRGGPAGPMTLCNACGIKSRKKRGAMTGGGSNKAASAAQMKEKKQTSRKSSNKSSGYGNGGSKSKLGGRSLDQRLIALGKEVLMRRSKTDQQRRRKLGEEEQAAVLLMALSYGYVYA